MGGLGIRRSLLRAEPLGPPHPPILRAQLCPEGWLAAAAHGPQPLVLWSSRSLPCSQGASAPRVEQQTAPWTLGQTIKDPTAWQAPGPTCSHRPWC